jgi:hypothetical protein
MTAQDFTVALFCHVDEAMLQARKHPLSKLHPSEVVTLGLLQALRGEGMRPFFRWVCKEMHSLFPHLSERSRLSRLLNQHALETQRFLAQPTLLGICDSYGIELLHPKRHGRSSQQIAKKGLSNWRWITGAKLGLLLNSYDLVISWNCQGANVHGAAFHPLIEAVQEQMVVLADSGFTSRRGNPSNLKVCRRNSWNERMLVETVLSLFTRVLRLKKLTCRTWNGLNTRLAYALAAFNLCVQWNGTVQLSLANFAL